MLPLYMGSSQPAFHVRHKGGMTFAASVSHPYRGVESRHYGQPNTGLDAALSQACFEPLVRLYRTTRCFRVS
jgi:hypothetical protein